MLQVRREAAFTKVQVASPLARRPYDLRHAGVSWRLNAGTPAPLAAEWAGHSVEVLFRIYAHCIDGDDERWFARMEESPGPSSPGDLSRRLATQVITMVEGTREGWAALVLCRFASAGLGSLEQAGVTAEDK